MILWILFSFNQFLDKNLFNKTFKMKEIKFSINYLQIHKI